MQELGVGQWKGRWGLAHARQLDTAFLRLQLDEFRNIRGVVNLRRGAEAYDPRKVIIFSHSMMYSNPFGQSDVRGVFRSLGLIQDCYRVWYVAMLRYAVPYAVGTAGAGTNRAGLEAALRDLEAGGYVVITEKDKVELLNLAGASAFTAFEAKVNKLREEVFMGVRGAYLPFLEGQGGEGAHGNVKVHKTASDVGEYMLGKDVALVINRQLIPNIVLANFGEDCEPPLAVIGGTDWDETSAQVKVAQQLKDLGLKLDRDQLHEIGQFQPPESPENAVGGPNKSEDLPDVMALQKSYYAGEVPQAACVAALVKLHGYAEPDALALFPPVDPVKRTDKQQPGGGMPGAGAPQAPPAAPAPDEPPTEPATFSDAHHSGPTAEQVARAVEELLAEMGA